MLFWRAKESFFVFTLMLFLLSCEALENPNFESSLSEGERASSSSDEGVESEYVSGNYFSEFNVEAQDSVFRDSISRALNLLFNVDLDESALEDRNYDFYNLDSFWETKFDSTHLVDFVRYDPEACPSNAIACVGTSLSFGNFGKIYFSQVRDPLYMAQILLHENWHLVEVVNRFGGHVDCHSGPSKACDDSFEFNAASRLQGAYGVSFYTLYSLSKAARNVSLYTADSARYYADQILRSRFNNFRQNPSQIPSLSAPWVRLNSGRNLFNAIDQLPLEELREFMAEAGGS